MKGMMSNKRNCNRMQYRRGKKMPGVKGDQENTIKETVSSEKGRAAFCSPDDMSAQAADWMICSQSLTEQEGQI